MSGKSGTVASLAKKKIDKFNVKMGVRSLMAAADYI